VSTHNLVEIFSQRDAIAETHLIGSIFLDANNLERLRSAGCDASWFSGGREVIYATLCDLADGGGGVTLGSFLELAKSETLLELCGGLNVVRECSGVDSDFGLSRSIASVKDLHNRRRIASAMQSAIEAIGKGSAIADAVGPTIEKLRLAMETSGPDAGGLTLWSPSEFLEYQPPASNAILGDGLIERGEWTSFLGVGGLGKSRLALWLCICIIIGRDWCGLPTHKTAGKILFLSTENGLRRWKTDLTKMLSGLTTDQRCAVDSQLLALALTPGEDGNLNLGDEIACSRFSNALKKTTPDLVILDPIADMIDGDENSTKDMVASLRSLRKILATNAPHAAALLIHHARTGAQNVAQAGDNYSSGNFGRGSKALYSRVRCEIQLAPGDKDDPDKLVLACGKSNNSERFAPRGLTLDPETFAYVVDPGFSIEDWRADVEGKRTGKALPVADVVKVVQESAPIAGTEVSFGAIQAAVKERFGASERTTRARLADCVDLGYLRTVKKGYYRLGSKPLPR
jgi:hypothetical protein